MNLRLFTIGHSTRSFEEFLALLREFEIGVVEDIRRYPCSRKFPHFTRDVFERLLNAQGIEYVWLEALGGFRHGAKKKDSPNTGLKSDGFRQYADYMRSEAFREAILKLLAYCSRAPTVVMCAEKLFWKCHRRLLSDYLTAQGVEVVHVIEKGRVQTHRLTPGAKVSDGLVFYPPGEDGAGT